MVVKILTNVIANRLKLLINDFMASNQSSFILGRHGVDNIVIAQELLHSMCKHRAKKSSIALKIDLEKAYDLSNWD